MFDFIHVNTAHLLNQNKHICLQNHHFFWQVVVCSIIYFGVQLLVERRGLSVVDTSPRTYSISPCLLYFSSINFLMQINDDCEQKQNLGHPVVTAPQSPISVGSRETLHAFPRMCEKQRGECRRLWSSMLETAEGKDILLSW